MRSADRLIMMMVLTVMMMMLIMMMMPIMNYRWVGRPNVGYPIFCAEATNNS